MAIVCPRCGREYDVTLFQFGRTIDCTCGARVGREQRLPVEGAGGESRREGETPSRFLADAMLGGLARWLRILGYDAEYDPSIDDRTLARRAVEERRRILTRDRRFSAEWRIQGVVVVEAEDSMDQLREVVDRLGLQPQEKRAFTRCPVCNAGLRPAGPGDVEGRVPERVLEEQDIFRRCPECGKLYWEGGHVRRMRRRLGDLLE